MNGKLYLVKIHFMSDVFNSAHFVVKFNLYHGKLISSLVHFKCIISLVLLQCNEVQ